LRSFCGTDEEVSEGCKRSKQQTSSSKEALEMLGKQFIVIVATAFIGGVGAVTYSWASWATNTLISVDKKTEVIASEISYIKLYMERDYGYVPRADETASVKTTR